MYYHHCNYHFLLINVKYLLLLLAKALQPILLHILSPVSACEVRERKISIPVIIQFIHSVKYSQYCTFYDESYMYVFNILFIHLKQGDSRKVSRPLGRNPIRWSKVVHVFKVLRTDGSKSLLTPVGDL